MNEKILIVDDDSDIREMMLSYFSKEGYEVNCAEDGYEALQLISSENFSIVLLDIMMPNLDGYETISKMREFTDIPVIFLTAKGEQMDKVSGFIKGCDDYVVKPFDFTELSFRIRAILKRTCKNFNEREKHILKVKDLEINIKEYSVKKNENYIKLTPKEFEILYLLASNKGRVYSTRIIYELIWKDAFLENDNSVLVHMRNLREKIGDKVKESKYIKTIWGVGYKIEKDS
ncbi:response regulator transcription factor [Clostridium lundense]|uniref:response regulator transcription factor n=1 Tax=Clostridium lundense TaxID=319475 RepID=UPI000487BC36|nr:response regulator transcription factor [Clostridium lundense]